MDMLLVNRWRMPVAGTPRGVGRLAVAVMLAGAIGMAPGVVRAAMYKWVDDKGVVHYSDQIPPEAVNKGSVQLNKEGYTVKKVDPATSPETIRAREQEQARQRDEMTKEKAQDEANARRDKAVLDSYTNESDIDLAKSRSVKTLQSALQSAQAYSAQLTKRKAELLARKESYGAKPVPADIERELAAGDAELARQSTLIAEKQKQLQEVIARYDADKERWRALKGAPGAPTAAAATPPAAAKKQ